LLEVDDLQHFVASVVNGVAIKKLKDRNKKNLTDIYLREQLSGDHSWVNVVYDQSSGYVHLSEKHIFGAIQEVIVADGSQGDLNIHIGQSDAYTPGMFYITLINAFQASTALFVGQVRKWVQVKASIMKNPDRTSRHLWPYDEETSGE
jgi:hypothetical protein